MRDKVTFSDNLPTQVILDSAGELQRNKAGDDEYRYFLAEDKIMWVPAEVHGAIQQHGAHEGDQLTITKQRTKRGGPVRWDVELHQDEPQYGRGVASSTRPPSTPAPIYDTPPTSRPRPTPVAEQPLTVADKLAGALAAAIDAAIEASVYADRQGLKLTWDAGDIRALAATLYIGEQKAGR